MSLQTKTPGAGKQPGATIESGRRKFTASHLAREAAGSLLLTAVIVGSVSLARCTYRAMHGTITPAPVNPALVFSDTKSEAVATPTDKRGFVTFKSLAGAGVSSPGHQGYGRDGATRKDARTASDVSLTSRPPVMRSGIAGGFLHVPEGA